MKISSSIFCLVVALCIFQESEARLLGTSSETCLFGKCLKLQVGARSKKDCIGENTLLYSCAEDVFVPAKTIRSGDLVKTMTMDGPICSEVYYTFHHEDDAPAMRIVFETSSSVEHSMIDVSPRHLMYVGESYSSRKGVMAKDLRPGDVLLTSSSADETPKQSTVISATPTTTKLINILTFEPALYVENDIIMSAHSYNERLYSLIFWPVRLMYKAFGHYGVDQMSPIFLKMDSHIVQPLSIMSGLSDL